VQREKAGEESGQNDAPRQHDGRCGAVCTPPALEPARIESGAALGRASANGTAFPGAISAS
jgi:hypothetical protein